MNPKLLGAFIVAPMIAFSGAALAHGGDDPQGDLYDLPPISTISYGKNRCNIVFDDEGTITGIGTEGRLVVKIDYLRPPLTTYGNCTANDFTFPVDLQVEPVEIEGFDCFVQITKAFGHFHQILYGADSDVTTKMRFKRGRATMSCSGPYDPDQCPVWNSQHVADGFESLPCPTE